MYFRRDHEIVIFGRVFILKLKVNIAFFKEAKKSMEVEFQDQMIPPHIR